MGMRCNDTSDVQKYPLLRGNAAQPHYYPDHQPVAAKGCAASRRVISRATAALVVAILGLTLLCTGTLTLYLSPAPNPLIGQEHALLRFLGIATTSAGTAALAAAACLAAASRLPRTGAASRLTLLALGAALMALG